MSSPDEILKGVPASFEKALAEGDLLFFPSTTHIHEEAGVKVWTPRSSSCTLMMFCVIIVSDTIMPRLTEETSRTKPTLWSRYQISGWTTHSGAQWRETRSFLSSLYTKSLYWRPQRHRNRIWVYHTSKHLPYWRIFYLGYWRYRTAKQVLSNFASFPSSHIRSANSNL